MKEGIRRVFCMFICNSFDEVERGENMGGNGGVVLVKSER
jgi:hypothetical protein